MSTTVYRGRLDISGRGEAAAQVEKGRARKQLLERPKSKKDQLKLGDQTPSAERESVLDHH